MTTYPKGRLQLQSESVGAMGVEVRVRDLNFHIDEPIKHGGTNLGPSPVESAVAALSSCVSIIIRVIAGRHEFDIKAVATTAKAEMDLRGIMFMEEISTPFTSIKLGIDLDADLKNHELAVLQEEVRKFCPLYSLFSEAGTAIEESWSVKSTVVN